MKLLIGDQLRSLRTAHGLTQERLAEALNVSAQSVSRWEQGVCYPDTELLPALANYFDVTLDELMGMDKIRSKQRRDAVFTAALDAERTGDLVTSAAILRDALSLDPSDDGLTAQLALVLSQSHERSNLIQAAALSEAILERCADDKLRHTVRANLCVLYHTLGQPERAQALARTLPHIWECREVLLPYVAANRSQAMQRFESILTQVQHDLQSNKAIPFSLGYAPDTQTH